MMAQMRPVAVRLNRGEISQRGPKIYPGVSF
jgi:hypothetical protein